jgi:hypothetical protein
MQGRHSALQLALDDSPRATLHGGLRQQKTPVPSRNERVPFYGWPPASRLPPPRATWNAAHDLSAHGRCAVSWLGSTGCPTRNAPADSRFFLPVVALSVVTLACGRPDVVGRSWSPWDRAELARPLVRAGVVAAISPQTGQRILAHHQLNPWRHHLGLSSQVPRDAAFAAQVQEIVAL